LRKLLEGKSPVAQDLGGNGASGLDFHDHICHLEDAPVFVLDAILEKTRGVLDLVGRVAHAGTVADVVLSGLDAGDQGLGHGNQTDGHFY